MNAPTKVDLDYIYSNVTLVTLVGENGWSSSTMPALVAAMLEFLDLEPGMKVLEIGTGTGYTTALLAEIVGDPRLVVSVDIAEDLVASASQHLRDLGYGEIRLLARDGFEGVPDEGSFDRILVTAGCPDLSPHWANQLKPEGLMLVPLWHGILTPFVKSWRDGERILGKFVRDGGFIRARGEPWTWELWPNGYRTNIFTTGTLVAPALEGLELGDIRAFHDFIALRDSRAFWHAVPEATASEATAYGIYDENNGAIAIHRQTGHVLLKGQPTLYDELLTLYNEWCAAGKPRLTDFDTEFIPIERELESTPQSTWVKTRTYYQQLFSLSV